MLYVPSPVRPIPRRACKLLTLETGASFRLKGRRYQCPPCSRCRRVVPNGWGGRPLCSQGRSVLAKGGG